MHDTLYNQLYEARRIIQEAFSKENVYVPERTEMLNALQGILERCESDHSDILQIDYEDLHVLYKNRHVIYDAAHIHDAFMGNHELAESLKQVVRNIEAAQENNWMPAGQTRKA